MANLESLNVQITGDVKGLATSIAKGEKSLDTFAATAEKTSSSVTKSLAATAAAANKVDSSLANYSKGSNQAIQATTNLSRVLQDAPFGFIGIANNLNPLLESFQRLGKETGGLKGALSALGSSILGAGGIGLALSAFQFFALGGVDAVKKMFGALGENKALAEARKEIDDFNKSLKDAEAGALSTGLKLQSFVNIAKNGQLPLEQRNEALKQANKLLGEHGKELTLTNINTAAATKEVELYTKALIAQAVATQYVDRIGKLTIQQTDLRKQSLKDLQALNKAQKENAKVASQSAASSELGGSIASDISVINNLANARKKYNETLQQGTSIALQLRDLGKDFNQAQLDATNFLSQLTTKDPEDAKKNIESISDIVAKLNKELAALQVLNQQGFLTSFELDSKSVDAYQKAVESIAKINPTAIEITNLSIKFNPIILRNLIEKEGQRLAKEKPIPIEAPIEIVPIIDTSAGLGNSVLVSNYTAGIKQILSQIGGESGKITSELKKKFGEDFSLDKLLENASNYPTAFIEKIKEAFGVVKNTFQSEKDKLNAQIDSILANTATEAFANFGENLGQLITGKITVGDLFGGLFSILGQGIQQLGKTLIEYGVFAKLAKSAFASAFANPIGAIAAGIALTAFGGIVKNAGALKLADGGYVSGAGTSRSDSVPAMLSNGEYVINAAAVRKFGLGNLDRINSLQGFAAGGVISVPQPYAVPTNNVSIDRGNDIVVMGETVLRGQDIYVLYNRAAKQAGRNS